MKVYWKRFSRKSESLFFFSNCCWYTKQNLFVIVCMCVLVNGFDVLYFVCITKLNRYVSFFIVVVLFRFDLTAFLQSIVAKDAFIFIGWHLYMWVKNVICTSWIEKKEKNRWNWANNTLVLFENGIWQCMTPTFELSIASSYRNCYSCTIPYCFSMSSIPDYFFFVLLLSLPYFYLVHFIRSNERKRNTWLHIHNTESTKHHPKW